MVSFTCLSLNSHPFLLLLEISSLEQHSENRAGRNVDQTQTGPSLSTRMRGSFYCIWHAARSNMYRFGNNMRPPPDDMNEPLYAHLAFFDFYCDACEDFFGRVSRDCSFMMNLVKE